MLKTKQPMLQKYHPEKFAVKTGEEGQPPPPSRCKTDRFKSLLQGTGGFVAAAIVAAKSEGFLRKFARLLRAGAATRQPRTASSAKRLISAMCLLERLLR